MSKYFHLKCRIENCNDGFNYPSDKCEAEGIIAIRAAWRDSSDTTSFVNRVLPEIKNRKYISIGGPLKIDFANDFWVYYEEPVSFFDGLDSLEGINSIRFCKCTHIESLNEGQHLVEILEVVDLNNNPLVKESKMPDDWKEFVKFSMKATDLISFDTFDLIDINIQGDRGMTFLIRKETSRHTLVMVHDWDFHRSVYYRTNIKLEGGEFGQNL